MRLRVGVIGLALLAAGCMPMDGEPDAQVPPRDDPRYVCNAAPVQGLVGQIGTQATGAEAVRASGARTMRWIAPDSAYTADYRADRLNIHLDRQNRVTKVNCG